MQNGYTQLESLGAAAQFGSPQRSQQSSSGHEESQPRGQAAAAQAQRGQRIRGQVNMSINSLIFR